MAPPSLVGLALRRQPGGGRSFGGSVFSPGCRLASASVSGQPPLSGWCGGALGTLRETAVASHARLPFPPHLAACGARLAPGATWPAPHGTPAASPSHFVSFSCCFRPSLDLGPRLPMECLYLALAKPPWLVKQPCPWAAWPSPILPPALRLLHMCRQRVGLCSWTLGSHFNPQSLYVTMPMDRTQVSWVAG